jgi:hypothetical protein
MRQKESDHNLQGESGNEAIGKKMENTEYEAEIKRPQLAGRKRERSNREENGEHRI